LRVHIYILILILKNYIDWRNKERRREQEKDEDSK